MVKRLFLIFSLISVYFLCSEESYSNLLDKEIEGLSFYMGYSVGRDLFKNSYGVPYKFDKIVEGMRAAERGDPIPQKEDLTPLIKRIQQEIVQKQSNLNLKEAQAYLESVAKEPDIVVVEPTKLFYIIKNTGQGAEINAHPWLHFKVYELENGTYKLKYSTQDDLGKPIQIDLEETVPGFEKGIRKMRIGEERRLYVHPDLAFGLGKQSISPNRLIIFDVIACENEKE
jgi:peptidylprolyl isomerase